MSDNSFFREVDEDLRSERLRGFWDRYGWIIISVAILVIAATAGWRGYEYWQSRQASQSGDAFLEALTLAREGESQAAMQALQELQEEGFGAYPVLARMRAATLQAESGEVDEAIAAFTAIGNDASVPSAISDVARLRAAYLMVDHATYDDVLAAVGAMAVEANAMRHSAREALGLAAWRAGDLETASTWFQQIADDVETPRGIAQRAGIMLDLIAAADPDAENPAAPPAPASARPQGQDGANVDAPVSLETIAPQLAPATGAEDDGASQPADSETGPDSGDAANGNEAASEEGADPS